MLLENIFGGKVYFQTVSMYIPFLKNKTIQKDAVHNVV